MHPALCDKILSLLPFDDIQVSSALDFGCGTGSLIGELAHRLPRATELIGLDAGETEIAQARAALPHLRFVCERFVKSLPFADASFDLLVTVDTLECVPDQQALLQEFARVLRPGGRIICAHWDWDTQVYASSQPESVRKLVHAFCDWKQTWMDASDGQTGRKLWGLFGSNGCFSGQMDVFCLLETQYAPGHYGYQRLKDLADLVAEGSIDSQVYAEVITDMESKARQANYFYSLNSYIYTGTRI
ncbi:MAG: hypothetical protein CVV27_16375 [Candidatus Melainabacteria bacterium HGW-Melainabacteria-1]|nr:MAG: hypothetical protein CVV27_16375 [Candidatus Melainabacteria bacterium HGW-Melainabacteria-1]